MLLQKVFIQFRRVAHFVDCLAYNGKEDTFISSSLLNCSSLSLMCEKPSIFIHRIRYCWHIGNTHRAEASLYSCYLLNTTVYRKWCISGTHDVFVYSTWRAWNYSITCLICMWILPALHPLGNRRPLNSTQKYACQVFLVMPIQFEALAH